MTADELNPLPRRSEAAVRAEGCDWGDCSRDPEAGAFCNYHADEYERVIQERNDEWWSE